MVDAIGIENNSFFCFSLFILFYLSFQFMLHYLLPVGTFISFTFLFFFYVYNLSIYTFSTIVFARIHIFFISFFSVLSKWASFTLTPELTQWNAYFTIWGSIIRSKFVSCVSWKQLEKLEKNSFVHTWYVTLWMFLVK